MLLNMDMHITGMFKIKDDGVINPNNVKFGARRVIPVGNVDNIQPLVSGGDIQFAMNDIRYNRDKTQKEQQASAERVATAEAQAKAQSQTSPNPAAELALAG